MGSFGNLHGQKVLVRAILKVMSNNENMWYPIGGFITGALVFIGVWIYALASWGFLVGMTIGWIPALISAVIAGFIWPVLAVVVIGIILLLFFG